MQRRPNISRRNFLKGGMTFAAGLALANIEGDLFSAVPAHAAEGAETTVMIVRPTEIGIVAYDLTDAENPIAVPDCHVTITSRFNGKSVEGTTNANGKIVLDIAALAETNSESDILAFNGSITVKKEGYREVNIPLARIVGHSAFVAPTRPLDGLPYFRSLTFNEWDVQYTAPEFLTSQANTEIHTITGQLWLPDATILSEAILVKSDGSSKRPVGTFTIKKQEENLAIVELSGEFLNAGAYSCLGEGADPKIIFRSKADGFETAINLSAKPAVVDGEQTKSEVMVPSTINHTYKFFTLPKTFLKPLGGSEFTIWQPTCPFIFQIAPAGLIIMGYGKSTIRAISDTGKIFPSADAWKSSPTQSFYGQLTKEIENEFKALENYKKQVAVPNSPGKTQKLSHKLTTKFAFDVTVQAFGSMSYNHEKDVWRGALSGVFAASFNTLWTQQATLMYIPVFLQISFSCTFNASIYLGVRQDKLDSSFVCTPERSLGFGVNFSLSVGVGVGVAGFISASVTGSGYVSYYINFLPNPDADSPRAIGGYGAKVYVTLQLMLFKYSFTICGVDEPQAFDSNDDKKPKQVADGETAEAAYEGLTEELKAKLGLSSNNSSLEVGSGDMPSYAELVQNAVIVTNAEMLCSREFKQNASLSSDVESSVSIEFAGLSAFEDVDDADEAGVDEVDDVDNLGDANYCVKVTPNDADFDGTPESYDFENPALPTYEYVGTMSDTAELSGLSVGVEGIADHNLGGIKPTYDELLFENITSNPKLRILTTVYGMTVMFRIATVEIGDGKARSRLVYHILKGGKWSEPNVVEFNPGFDGVARDDMYDFDFDVAQGDAYDGCNYIFLTVTSGTRPKGDNTTFKEGMQARYCSLVCLYDSNFDTNPLRNYSRMTCGLVSAGEGGTYICPTISVLSDPTSVVGTKDFCVMASIIGKSVDEKSMNNPTGSRRVYFARWETDTDTGNEVFRVDRSRPYRVGCGVNLLFPTCIDDEKYEHQWGSCALNRRVTAASLCEGGIQIYKYWGLYSDNLPWKKYFLGVGSELIATGYASAHHVDKVWKFGSRQGYMLGSCKATDAGGEKTSAIFKLEFDPKNEGGITYTQIGSVEGGVSDFVSDPDGHYLFFAENIDGKTGQEYVLDDAGEPTGEVKDIISHKYYIKAMAHVDGLFTKPFVFAELEHAADSLAATCVNDEYITFMVDDITDMSKSISNLYDVRVPIVKCLTPVSLSLVDPFCFSGEAAGFSLEVRNDGNLVATGATFKFINAETGELVESKTLKFSELPTLEDDAAESAVSGGFDVASLADSDLADHVLVQNNGQNVLLPGCTRAINLTFAIPDTWGGEKRVRVEIENILYLSPTALEGSSLAGDDFSVASYHIPEENTPTVDLDITEKAASVSGNLASGEVRKRGTDGDDGSAGKKTTPKTGDSAGGSVALAALGAAAAGVAAYSARRSAIEAGELDE